MRIKVVAIGDAAKDPLIVEARALLERAGRRYDAGLIPLASGKRNKGAHDERVRADEGRALLKASDGCHRIALDATGKQHDSPALSRALEDRLARGRPVAFLLGGATGLSDEVREACDELWSLSKLTFPHRLALLVLAEQIYRAHEIARGGPYHK